MAGVNVLVVVWASGKGFPVVVVSVVLVGLLGSLNPCKPCGICRCCCVVVSPGCTMIGSAVVVVDMARANRLVMGASISSVVVSSARVRLEPLCAELHEDWERMEFGLEGGWNSAFIDCRVSDVSLAGERTVWLEGPLSHCSNSVPAALSSSMAMSSDVLSVRACSGVFMVLSSGGGLGTYANMVCLFVIACTMC